MKRFLAVLTAVCLLFCLSACGSADHALSAVYSGGIQATDGRVNYMADLESDGETVRIVFSAPESIAGLSYTFRGEELCVGLNGHDCITSPDSLPTYSVPSLLYHVLTQAENAAFCGAEDGAESYTLNIGGKEASVTAKDGAIESMTCKNTTVYFQ